MLSLKLKLSEIMRSLMSAKIHGVQQRGPGQKSILADHRKIMKGSRYMPHQGVAECARRVRQGKTGPQFSIKVPTI